MAANTSPIFSVASDVQCNTVPVITAASVVYDGSGTIATDVYKIFTADATNGGFVQRVRVKYVANATTTSVATVLKFFISNKTSGATTNADTWFYDEIAIPATGALTTTGANATYDVMFGFAIPASYTILVKTTVSQSANTGFVCTAIAGKY